MSKIFGVGFHKTGTTSLADALRVLGYTVTGPNFLHEPSLAERVRDLATSVVPKFDAFQDNPWPLLYKFLDQQYPGSKFIFTWRDEESWLRSAARHFGERETPMREWIYGAGSVRGNEAVYLERYRRHNSEVRDYFSGRSADFLELRITEGEGWEKLCPFLGLEAPEIPFPAANTAEAREASEQPKGLGARLGRLLGRI